MTYDPNIPNAAQSPGLFPPQNNTNFTRLKTIINADHVFNDSAQSTDGAHKQVTLINRDSPGAVPGGTNAMLYSKAAADGVNELWFYNNATNNQVNWRELSGSFVLPASARVTIAAIPPNCFGDIYIWRARQIQRGTFISDSGVVEGYSFKEKCVSGSSSNDRFIDLAFGADANALNLSCFRSNGVAGTWFYRIFFRKQ